MRNATCCLLVVLFGSWSSSLGQSAPKFTSPQIVATFERLGQTADIPPTTIYTPRKWGTFRISIVMVGIEANGTFNTDWETQVHFTDANGENVPCSVCEVDLALDRRRNSVGEFPIRAKAGAPIKVSVTSQGNTQNTKYNVWVVVEQLM